MNSSFSGDDSTSSNSDEEIQQTIPEVAGNRRTPPTGLSHSEPAHDRDNTTVQQPITGPGDNDVLLGRGRPYQNFSGNKRMLHIVAQFKDEYSARPRDQKRAFVETVLDVVLKDDTKFLRRVEEGDGSSRWEEVDRTAAAEKVWHALRCKERPKHPRGKRKAGDERGSSPHGAEAVLSPHSQVQGEPRQLSSPNMASAHAVLRDIQQHLDDAVAATNLLASLITRPRPASSTGTGNAAAVPAAAPLYPPAAAPLYSPTYQQAYGNAPAQQSVSTLADMLNLDWIRSQRSPSIPPNVQPGVSQQFLPLSYAGVSEFATLPTGLAPPPLPILPPFRGMVDPSRASFASAAEQQPSRLQNSQPVAQPTDRSQILAHAVGILMQAAQQGALPPA
jgi:hypothetical protein